MTNVTILGVFRTHAQKEYGKVWVMKSIPILNILALLLFSAAAVYNQIYSKLSTNQKQSYICKSAIYARWNGLSKISTNKKQSFICKSAIVLRRRDTEDTKQYLMKCFRSITMASLLSMLIETDYNFKKITAVFFGSCLKEFHSVWNCMFIKQNAKLFQHIITFCLKYVGAICFVVSGSARVAHFTRLCLKAVTEPNSAEPTELTEYSLF